MAKQWFVPGGGQVDEVGVEEWFAPGVGQINEDEPEAVPPTDGLARVIFLTGEI